jgi:hypothetical protein
MSHFNMTTRLILGPRTETWRRALLTCSALKLHLKIHRFQTRDDVQTVLTHRVEPFLRSCQLCSYSRTSQHFMEPECSLPWSQEPSTGPLSWARSIQSITSHHISLRSILILFNHLRLGLPNGFLPSGFPTNILDAFLFSPFVLHVLPISCSLTWSF